MDPEFVRIITRVLIIGFVVTGGGATALYFAFRSFGKPGGQRGFLWLTGIAFVILVICVVLWRLSGYGAQ
jgi:hypothetical protein